MTFAFAYPGSTSAPQGAAAPQTTAGVNLPATSATPARETAHLKGSVTTAVYVGGAINDNVPVARRSC